MKKQKILFILKRRTDYDATKHSALGMSTGLFNSATFMVEMLNDMGIDAALEVAIDNNCIDKFVHKHKPTHVIIEAIWVVPSKFIILSKLHPTVKWIIRIHSEMPFIAGESIAMDWLGDYASFSNISFGVNSPRMLEEMRTFYRIKQEWDEKELNERVFFMPNFYPQEYKRKEYEPKHDRIDIGCFSAVRPLKNQLLQAISAVKFADHIGKKCHFHINAGRVEMKGEPVLNNLRSLFAQLYDQGHRLIQHEWTPREEFLKLCAKMDIGLQVSFSETFNIVGADLISQGVPIVASLEIPWLDSTFSASATDSEEIYRALLLTHHWPQHNVSANQHKLTEYTSHTRRVWVDHFNQRNQNEQGK